MYAATQNFNQCSEYIRLFDPVLDLTKSLMGEFTEKKFAERIW
jgi:hypothetical protein